MKLISLIAFVLLVGNSMAQYSVSVGGHLHFDDFRSYQGKPTLHKYNGFVIQGDYQKDFFRLYTEIGYLSSRFELVQTLSNGNSGAFYSLKENKEYHSNVFVDYFTFKIGIGTVLTAGNKDKIWWEFSGNLFFQFDKFNREMETDQVMFKTTNSSQLVNGQWIHSSTEYPPDYTPYNLISFSDKVLQFGPEIKIRFGYQNYFTELSCSLGLMDRSRVRSSEIFTSNENSLMQSSLWNLNTGIKIGYVFNKKTKTVKEIH